MAIDFMTLPQQNRLTYTDDGTLKVCDVNSNPGVDVIGRATGINVVNNYANYIIGKL